jgi:hypothetical protein
MLLPFPNAKLGATAMDNARRRDSGTPLGPNMLRLDEKRNNHRKHQQQHN